jgi:hypothetical protein
VSQPGRIEREPARIVNTQIAAMPGGDVAELVNDSRGAEWARWYTASSRSWSAWWRIPGKPGVVALSGPYSGPDEGAADAALVAVVGRSPGDRLFFRLAPTGLTPIRLS